MVDTTSMISYPLKVMARKNTKISFSGPHAKTMLNQLYASQFN